MVFHQQIDIVAVVVVVVLVTNDTEPEPEPSRHGSLSIFNQPKIQQQQNYPLQMSNQCYYCINFLQFSIWLCFFLLFLCCLLCSREWNASLAFEFYCCRRHSGLVHLKQSRNIYILSWWVPIGTITETCLVFVSVLRLFVFWIYDIGHSFWLKNILINQSETMDVDFSLIGTRS